MVNSSLEEAIRYHEFLLLYIQFHRLHYLPSALRSRQIDRFFCHYRSLYSLDLQNSRLSSACIRVTICTGRFDLIIKTTCDGSVVSIDDHIDIYTIVQFTLNVILATICSFHYIFTIARPCKLGSFLYSSGICLLKSSGTRSSSNLDNCSDKIP